MTPPFRSVATSAAVLLVALLSLAVAPTVGAHTAGAQTVADGGDPATAPCIEGAPERGAVPPGTTRDGAPPTTVTGPSPVGRCEPTAGQRIIDNLNLVWILALLGFGLFVAVRWATGDGRSQSEGADDTGDPDGRRPHPAPGQPDGGPATRH